MSHLSEEELILHYYGEEGDSFAAERHLEECGECRNVYASIQRALNMAGAVAIPERGPEYGAKVWMRLQPRLAGRSFMRWFPAPVWRWAAAGTAIAVLLIGAFLAGRISVRPSTPRPLQLAGDPGVRERVLLVAVGDYLERSQMVLVELANASAAGPLDITAERERAQDLVNETRLYRQTAAATGNAAVSSLLDELERVMLDIARGPSRLSPAEIEQFRQRLESEGIIFKIRVVNANVQNQEEQPAQDSAGRRL